MTGVAETRERGSALPYALVFTVILATMGLAVLAQQTATSRAQETYTAVNARELALDGAVDATLAGIRYDADAGISPLAGRTATACGQPASTGPGSLMGPFTWEHERFDVYCAPEPMSGVPTVSPDLTTPASNERVVTITICTHDAATPCDVDETRVRARVRIIDRWGQEVGAHLRVLSWIRDPSV